MLATPRHTAGTAYRTDPPPRDTGAAAPVPALRPPAPPQSPKRRLWRWGAALLLALLLGGIAFARFWMAGPPVVAVETATWAPVTRVLAVNGRIAAVNAVDMRPTVTGSLIALPVAEGDLVAAGQILARIDAAAQNAMVRQAMAGLDSALVAQKQAQETYERAAALGPNVASTVLESNAYAVQTAAQEVARQTAALDQAQIALENHTLRAPIAGSVLALDAELGQIVGPSIPLLTLADLGNLMVEADVDESYAMQIAVDQPAALQLAGETSVRDGRVSFVSTRVDAATGGLGVRVVFDDPVTAPIGLTVALNIIVDRRDAALTVPRTALLTDAEGTGVFVVREGVAQRHPLSVLDWPAARLIVTGGLEEGDLVITDTTGIADGQTVAVDRP